jgi:hypothetical protein
MTLPDKIQLYLSDQAASIETSMRRSGNNVSTEIRERIRRSYEAETIIRGLLTLIDAPNDPHVTAAKRYLESK